MVVGGSHAAENNWRNSDIVVRGLSRSRAPGLEQKYGYGSRRRRGIHRAVWCSSGLGCANIVLGSTLSGSRKSKMINAFAGREPAPSVEELKRALGKSFELWHELIEDLKSDLHLDGQEWNKSSPKSGWALRLQLKKRNIVYLSPGNGMFLASFALGGRAMEEVKRSTTSSRSHEQHRQCETLRGGNRGSDRNS